MLKKLMLFPVFIFLAAILFYLGTCVVVNIKDSGIVHINLPTNTAHNPPAPEKAKWKIQIDNTGEVFYAENVSDMAGIVTMQNFYQNTKKGWVFQSIPVTMDRKYFGGITISFRT